MTESNVLSIEVLNLEALADQFRGSCLDENNNVICTEETMHDDWLITGRLSRIWWLLERDERDPVADFVIRTNLFVYISQWRSGKLNCEGGEGNWSSAVCLHNALIRFLRFANGMYYYDEISDCYWKRNNSTEHCYIEEEFNLPVKAATVTAYGAVGFGHGICAFQMDKDDVSNFNNWRFFQYKTSNIKPGNGQMPCGYEGRDIYVEVDDIENTLCNGYYSPSNVAEWRIDSDCNIYPLSLSSGLLREEEQKREMNMNMDVELRIQNKLKQLREIPELNIVGWIEREKEIMLFVSELNTEILKLENTMLENKIIKIKRILF